MKAGLGPEEIERLSHEGSLQSVARRSIVPLDGPALVVVVEGLFRIFRNAAFVRDVSLGLGSPGDVLAAASAFGERGAETGAEALSEGRIVLLAQSTWERLAAAEPELWLKLSASVARRLTRLQQRVEEVTRSGVEARVAAALGELADSFGRPVEGGLKLDLPLSQEDLARLAGTTRETCSAIVAEFSRQGIVRGGRLRGMLVIDAEALRRAAERTL
jgi:CRP-like cAMP-binding protein